ncbi:MAG: hypothetical protein ABEJ56_01630 [Candidatus Nanohaloarchaea archaeon]
MAIAIEDRERKREKVEEFIENDVKQILSMTEDIDEINKDQLADHLESVYESIELEVGRYQLEERVEEVYQQFMDERMSEGGVFGEYTT